MLFARLRPQISAEIPGEELHFLAKLSKGTAGENSMFNVASICSYAFTPDKSAQYDAWQKQDVDDEKLSEEKANWLLHEGKRIVVKNSFDFILETIGVFNNATLIKKAIKIMKEKISNVQVANLQIEEHNTTMKNSFDIILENQGYTLGKALEFALYDEYYEKMQTMLYVGFSKKHPHDAGGILRLSYKNKTSTDTVREHLQFTLDKLGNIFNSLITQF